MLWYLHLCAEAAIVVTHYIDQAIGTLQETEEGGGRFTEVVLHPIVTVKLNDF
jgi:organic hydroperoxide reductase OsmC/OhrA